MTGPESTAKSTLAHELSVALELPLVTEAAREYLAERKTYGPRDLLAIALLQQAAERAAGEECVCDTDLQVLYVWWQEKFGPAPRVLSQAYAAQDTRFYLLCAPDIDWQPDPLRENAQDRDRLIKIYERDLQRRNLPYATIRGAGQARMDTLLKAIEKERSR
jgi:nicotinamide riboside kinase